MRISVVICTYNPDKNIFGKCIDAISAASRLLKPEEILIIDNNSNEPVDTLEYVKRFLNSMPEARIVRESTQGLTPARLRGIKESIGELIIFVDDDNFIDENYFLVARNICIDYPFIGAFSGQATLKYDKEPEDWTRKYWGMLIHRHLTGNVWSNIPFNNDTMPNGAGLCISRDVADYYYRVFEEGKRPFLLDRSKGSLMSGGDNDLAMCACDIGKGMGLFKDLHLWHYIPQERFTLGYLSRLAYGIYYSFAMLLYMRTGKLKEDTIPQRLKHALRVSIMKKKRSDHSNCR